MRGLICLLVCLLPFCAFAHEVERSLQGGPCTVPPLDGWSAGEKWAWGEICAGRIANMSEFSGDEAGCEAWVKDGAPANWPEARTLSARFLHTIATRHPFTDAPARPAVRIQCAVVVGQLDFSDETVPQTLWVDFSRLSDGLSLYVADFGGDLSLDGSLIVGGPISANGLRVADDFVLRQAHFPGWNILGAKVGGAVDASGSTFTGLFNADGLEVAGGLFLRGGATFAEGVNLLGAKVGGNVEADGSTFTGLFDADGLEVAGYLFLRDGATFEEGVNLLGAKVGGNVEAGGSTFTGLFQADLLEVAGGLYLRGGATFAEGVDLLGARVGGTLQLQGSVYRGVVDLSSADIGDELLLSTQGDQPIWEGDAALILRNTHAGAVQATMPDPAVPTLRHSWRRKDVEADTYTDLPVDLANFTYDRLGGLGAGVEHDVTRIRPERLIAWIEHAVAPDHTKNDGYAPQPYMQLADTLRRDGANAAADAVDYARFKHRMETRDSTWLWLVDAAARVFVGFGVYPQRAFYWFLGLLIVGWAVTGCSRQLRTRGMWERFFYSLENQLPLVDLSQGFKDITHGDARVVANFFHFQKIAGFLLATVLVGALTVFGG